MNNIREFELKYQQNKIGTFTFSSNLKLIDLAMMAMNYFNNRHPPLKSVLCTIKIRGSFRAHSGATVIEPPSVQIILPGDKLIPDFMKYTIQDLDLLNRAELRFRNIPIPLENFPLLERGTIEIINLMGGLNRYTGLVP